MTSGLRAGVATESDFDEDPNASSGSGLTECQWRLFLRVWALLSGVTPYTRCRGGSLHYVQWKPGLPVL